MRRTSYSGRVTAFLDAYMGQAFWWMLLLIAADHTDVAERCHEIATERCEPARMEEIEQQLDSRRSVGCYQERRTRGLAELYRWESFNIPGQKSPFNPFILTLSRKLANKNINNATTVDSNVIYAFIYQDCMQLYVWQLCNSWSRIQLLVEFLKEYLAWSGRCRS